MAKGKAEIYKKKYMMKKKKKLIEHYFMKISLGLDKIRKINKIKLRKAKKNQYSFFLEAKEFKFTF